MRMIKSMVLGSFLMMGLSFCASAEVPAAPPAGLKDLGADATVELGSNASDGWNVDKDFLLKEGGRTGEYKDQFAFHTNNDEPWFIVTLKSPADIKTIYIQNRISEPQDRAKGLIVSVSNDKKTWKEIWKAADVQPEWESLARVKGRHGLSGPIIDQMEKQLTPEQFALVQRLCRAFKPRGGPDPRGISWEGKNDRRKAIPCV